MESLGRQIFSLACLDTARLQPVDKVNLGAASGNNQLLKKRASTWREVFRPPEMSSVNFRIRKKYIHTFGKFSVFEVETRNSKIGRGNRVLEKEFRFLPITQVGFKEHVPLTIFHSFPINACVPKNRVVESGGH